MSRCIIYIYSLTCQLQMRRYAVNDEHDTSWAQEEFADVSLGDKRLDARLIKLCNRFSDAPESPIKARSIL